MDGAFNPVRSLGEIPASHRDKLRYLEEADRSVLDTIGLGVLFVMAFWSGTSRTAFTRLKEALAKEDPDGLLQLVVVNIDGSTDLQQCPEFHNRWHGAGETAWITAGRIVCTATVGSPIEAFPTFTRHLVQESHRVAFDPIWRTSVVTALAAGIYEERAFDHLPILADALQDAGCDREELLAHLRDPAAVHVRGCWALDLVLGRE